MGSFFMRLLSLARLGWCRLSFSLYQGVVAILSHKLGLPLTTTGRLVSGLFFLAVLIPLWFLVREMKLGLRFYFFSALLLLFSPLYLYWSRTFMIESTAVFLAFPFWPVLPSGYRHGAKKVGFGWHGSG